MLSPEYLLRVSEGGEAIAETLHNEIIQQIIERIAIRLSRGDNYVLTARDKWQIEILEDAGYLREDIERIIAEKTGLMQKEIAEAMEEAGVKALDYDDAIYRSAGLSPAPLTQSPYLIRLMQRVYEATVGEWVNFTRTTAEACQQQFIQACDKAYTMVASGASGYGQAYVDAINDIVDKGVVVTYPSGHTDTIETATLRCIRTGVSQSTAQITDARMDEMGWDIILVSSHLGARVTDKQDFTNHYWWQGKFYSKSGKDQRFPPYSVCNEGHVQGIHGANCRHSHGPGDGEFNPYKEYDSEENRREYELQQRQRLMERRIRDSKRKCQGLQKGVESAQTPEAKAMAEAAYQRQAALLQKRNEAYNDFCEENNLKKLNERITIAKWDRSQAAKARAAAKKYSVDHPNAVVPKEYKPKKVVEKKPTTIAEVNQKATDQLLDIYDARRKRFDLNLTPAADLRGSPINNIKVDYTGVSVETASAFSETIHELSKEYYCGFTKIEVMDPKQAFGVQAFASTSTKEHIQQRTLSLNPFKVKDFDKMTDRISELSKKGYCVKIAPGKEAQYIATHEFGHSLMAMDSPLKNYVGMDTKMVKNARKEIQAIYDQYISSISEIETKRGKLEFEFLTSSDTSRLAEIQKEISRLRSGKISNYSMVSADEFLAEAFTDCIIGVSPSEYSKRVLAVLDKYFKR